MHKLEVLFPLQSNAKNSIVPAVAAGVAALPKLVIDEKPIKSTQTYHITKKVQTSECDESAASSLLHS